MRLCWAVTLKMLFLISYLSPGCVQAQTEVNTKIPKLKSDQENLVQGRFYSPNYFPIKGSPFLTKEWNFGIVQLLGKEYQSMPIWYDIFIDEVILLIKQDTKLHFVRMNKPQIQYFTIGDKRFINLAYSEYQDLPLDPGFYEVGLRDKVSLLIRRRNQLDEEDKTLIQFFIRRDQWFMILDDEVFQLRGRKSLLEAVGDHRKQDVKRFLKQEKIRLKQAGDEEWLQVVQFINSLQADEQ